MYLISTTKNTHGLLTFDHDRAPGSDLFFEGTDLAGIRFELVYHLKRRTDAKRFSKFHLIHSNGPELVSKAFREILEKIAPDDVEFFEPRIMYGCETIEGFSAINVKARVRCVDLETSEYRQTNFDPVSPVYSFSYIRLLEQSPATTALARCEEQPAYMVAGEHLKSACLDAGLQGLMFCRAIDMTYGDRSDCQRCG